MIFCFVFVHSKHYVKKYDLASVFKNKTLKNLDVFYFCFKCELLFCCISLCNF